MTKGSVKNQEIFDLSVVPNVIALLRNIVETMQDNYPEMFQKITVTPASWFFQTCFKITGKMFVQKIRDRFHLVSEKKALESLDQLYPNGELSRRIAPINVVPAESSSLSHYVNEVGINRDIRDSDIGDGGTGDSWYKFILSTAIVTIEARYSLYYLWLAHEYISCHYLYRRGWCRKSGVHKVRSRDVMTF
jgi:hypothetical protein